MPDTQNTTELIFSGASPVKVTDRSTPDSRRLITISMSAATSTSAGYMTPEHITLLTNLNSLSTNLSSNKLDKNGIIRQDQVSGLPNRLSQIEESIASIDDSVGTLADLRDVAILSPCSGQGIMWSGSIQRWVLTDLMTSQSFKAGEIVTWGSDRYKLKSLGIKNGLIKLVNNIPEPAILHVDYLDNTSVASAASKLETPRQFKVTGGVVTEPIEFDGTEDVAMVVTKIDASSVNEGVLSVEYGGTGVTTSTGSKSVVLSESPNLTGEPTAPTQPVADSSTKIATTAFIRDVLARGANVKVVETTGEELKAGNYSIISTGVVRLPSSPAVNTIVHFRAKHTTNISINASGSKIEGDTSDLILDTKNAEGSLVYVNSTLGWILI